MLDEIDYSSHFSTFLDSFYFSSPFQGYIIPFIIFIKHSSFFSSRLLSFPLFSFLSGLQRMNSNSPEVRALVQAMSEKLLQVRMRK